MIFKGSLPRLKFQDCILRYHGSRIRLHTQNSFVGVIFDAQQNDQNFFKISKISNNLWIKSKFCQYHFINREHLIWVERLLIFSKYTSLLKIRTSMCRDFCKNWKIWIFWTSPVLRKGGSLDFFGQMLFS